MEKSTLKKMTDFRNQLNTKDDIIKKLTYQLEEKNTEPATTVKSQSNLFQKLKNCNTFKFKLNTRKRHSN